MPVRVTGGPLGREAGVVREVSYIAYHTVVAMASGEVCTFGRYNLGRLGHRNADDITARLQSSFRILVTWALLAKLNDWNCSKPRLMRTFRLVRRV